MRRRRTSKDGESERTIGVFCEYFITNSHDIRGRPHDDPDPHPCIFGVPLRLSGRKNCARLGLQPQSRQSSEFRQRAILRERPARRYFDIVGLHLISVVNNVTQLALLCLRAEQIQRFFRIQG